MDLSRSYALLALVASCTMAVAACAIGAESADGAHATTDGDADADTDADGDSDSDPEPDPDCGMLLNPGVVTASGHFQVADLCAATDSVNPCAQGGGADFGLGVVPPLRSLVTFSGGVVAGAAYLAVRRDCADEPTQCIFDLRDEALTVPLWAGERIFVHGGSMDDRDCASVRVDLSVWVLECGMQAFRLPREHPLQVVVPEEIFWGDGPEELYMVMDGHIGALDLAGPGSSGFSGWLPSGVGAERFVSHVARGDRLYLLSQVCAEWAGEGEDVRCLEERQLLEVFDTVRREFVSDRPLPGAALEQIALLGDWLVGIGGGELLVFELEGLSSVTFDSSAGMPVEPIVELASDDRALLTATRYNLYAIYRSGREVGFAQLAPAPDGASDIDVRRAEAADLVAAVGGADLSLFELRRLDVAPFLDVVQVGGAELDVVGGLESVAFIDASTLVVAVSGPEVDPARGLVVVVDVSRPASPVVTLELEARWLPGVHQVLGHPTRPAELLVNEEAGIGVVDLSRCP